MSAPAVDARLSVDRPFSVSVVEVAGALGTGDDGLSHAEAADRLALVGPNLLPEPKRTPAWLRFLSHFNDTLIYILLGAAAIKADLIVMTSHRPAMRTYFLGSNAGHVVRYAKCSVLVVRH